MKSLFFVFIGGGLGSAGRYLLAMAFNNKSYNFPFGTFLANVIGSLLIGILLAIFMRNHTLESQYKMLAIVGFCGGFTTMSSFSAESMTFLRNGDFFQFGIYLLLTISICLLFTYLGFQLTK